ncbi:MAG: DUF1285 domain-containing protein [Thermodesulfobacteriota bacterium]|nr:DUF1285 domain-containing protein [Thermodesulfobacteriota bacterium]
MSTQTGNNQYPFSIKIDKEGVWYYNGAEMFRKDIVNLFYEGLKRDESGQYRIELENDWCFIEVEDVPFVVKAVSKSGSKGEGSETIEIFLNDGSSEELDLSSIRAGKDNVLYCTVKKGEFDARFSRAAYYQIADYIDHDEGKDAFYIPLNRQVYYIGCR